MEKAPVYIASASLSLITIRSNSMKPEMTQQSRTSLSGCGWKLVLHRTQRAQSIPLITGHLVMQISPVG